MAAPNFRAKRTSFLFSPLASRQIDELMRRTRLNRDTDLLAVALEVLAEMIGIVTTGGHILIKARKANKVWAYSPYSPPVEYPHFSPTWSEIDADTEKERRGFSFDGEMLDRVDEIRRASRFQSLSDVVRAAIAVLNELLSAEEARDQIVVRDGRGRDRPYSVLAGPLLGAQRQRSLKVVPFDKEGKQPVKHVRRGG